MPPPDEDFALALAGMRLRYRTRLLDLLDLLRPIRDRAGADALSADDRDLIVQKSHQFAGSGGSFGFPGLSAAASNLEYFMVDNPQAAPAEILPQFDAFLTTAEVAAAEIEASGLIPT